MITDEERKQRIKERNRAYYEAHKEELKAKQRERHHKNAEREKARSRAYYEAHKEQVRAQQFEYALKNRAKILAQKKEWHAAHRDEDNARRKAHYYKNIEHERENARRRYWEDPETVKAKRRKYRKIKRLVDSGESDPKARMIVWAEGFDLNAALDKIWERR